MNAYPHLVFAYFNGRKPSFQFRVTDDTPLADQISKLNTLLRYIENQRVVKLEYRSPSLDSEKTNFEQKTDEDLQIMWNTFYHYASKGPIEVDAKIERSVSNIIDMLQRLELPIYKDI